MLEKLTTNINNALYGYILIILLIGAGLFFSFKTKFAYKIFDEDFENEKEYPHHR